MNGNHTDSTPAPSWSGNPIAAGAPGTAGTLDSTVQPDPSQQTALEDWEDEGGSTPPRSDSTRLPPQGTAWHHIDATASPDRLPPWLVL